MSIMSLLVRKTVDVRSVRRDTEKDKITLGCHVRKNIALTIITVSPWKGEILHTKIRQ